MKLMEAIGTAVTVLVNDGCSEQAETLREFHEAPFPCGFEESSVHLLGTREYPMVATPLGLLTTDDVRGLCADWLRTVDEIEHGENSVH